MNLLDFPDELIIYISKHLTPNSFLTLSQTCRHLQSCLDHGKRLTFYVQDPTINFISVLRDGFTTYFTQTGVDLTHPIYDYTLQLYSTTSERLYGLRKRGDRNVFSKLPLGTQVRYLKGPNFPHQCVYFEAHILECDLDSSMRIGLANAPDHSHPPGSTFGSVGYQRYKNL